MEFLNSAKLQNTASGHCRDMSLVGEFYSFFVGELIRVERSEKFVDDDDVAGDDDVAATVAGDEVAGDALLLGVATDTATVAAAVVATTADVVVTGASCLHISFSRDMCCRYISC